MSLRRPVAYEEDGGQGHPRERVRDKERGGEERVGTGPDLTGRGRRGGTCGGRVKQGSSLQTSSSFTAIKVKTGKGGDTPALLARRCTALEYVLVAIGAPARLVHEKAGTKSM